MTRQKYGTAAIATGRRTGTATLVWLVALACLFLFALRAPATAQQDDTRRMALVVGNAAYDVLAPIDHAAGDAREVAATLEALDFEVSLLINSDSLTFNAALTSFASRAAGADTVMLYFAGHGFQYAGSNYLVPVDARLSDPATAIQEASNLEELLARLSATGNRSIVLLDASQDSPLPPGLQGAALRGLTVPGIAPETFVAFAAQPGMLTPAARGGGNPFTQALRDHIPTTGQTISQMMTEVRGAVQAATGGRQIPWEQSSLTAPFFFAPFRPGPEDFRQVAAMPEAQRAFLLNIWRSQGADITREDLDARLAAAPAAAPAPAPAPTAAPAPAAAAPKFSFQFLEEDSGDGAPAPPAIAIGAPPTAAPPRVTRQRTEALPDAPIARLVNLRPPNTLYPRTDDRARIVGRDITDIANAPDDLARAMQIELQRLGCYTSRIDGDWGRGSRRAMQRFIDASGETGIDDLNPSASSWNILVNIEEAVCGTAPAPRAAPVASSSSSSGGSSSSAAAAPAPAPAAPAAPAATGRSLGRALGNAFR